MKLRDAFKSGKFVVTAEAGPGKGTDVGEFLHSADVLKGKVDAVNCTDQQSAVMRVGSLAACILLKEKGVQPILQMTCRDRNRISLQSELLSAAVLGIENVLALTGDDVTLGDHPHAKPVFDLDSVSLLYAARQLEAGKDLAGKELKGTPKFFLGACVTPGADPIGPQMIKLEKKIKAGAEFIQTQAVYEPEKFARFMKEAGQFGVPIMVGIVVLKSAGMAKFMNKNVAGINVPDSIISQMEKAEDKVKKGLEIAAELIKEMRPICQGTHIMAIGMEHRVPEIVDMAGL
ncbi:MAG TPA: methylenetetrahydrofolate reductase [Dehalococcoidia bacterium]|nr:methylenetetrahydrofolate reductase [Dehalococcoidia bacterium]